MYFTGMKIFRFLFAILVFCSQSSNAQTGHPQQFLLRDEGLSQLSYTNLSDASKNWQVPIPAGRDMQLVGRNRVLIGTNNGYEERDITNGNKLFELSSFPGTISARRLKNGNTMLVGVNWQDAKGIVLVELNATGAIQQKIVYPGFNYVRLLRETGNGNYLISANDTIIEGNKQGAVVWMAKIISQKQPHAWQPVRLANGQTLVSGGYSGNIQIFAADGKLLRTIGGPDDVKPNFYSGHHILPNGHIVVTNWQGHGPNNGALGTQLLEYDQDGKLVWSWKQDPARFSSLHAVIILDQLDTKYLHVENENGVLSAVK
jgi:hypothetical protein